MKINSVNFTKSSQKLADCPPMSLPEFAFIGRSNVGKSSLINSLMQRKKLAKVSATPGKTQLINHFEINNEIFIVDLPGYGWANVSKAQKENWEKNINDYLLERDTLIELFVLIDIRHDIQKIDLGFIEWLYEVEIPFSLIFTKSDKLSKNKALNNASSYMKKMKAILGDKPNFFISSSESHQGRDEILDYIQELNNEYKNIDS